MKIKFIIYVIIFLIGVSILLFLFREKDKSSEESLDIPPVNNPINSDQDITAQSALVASKFGENKVVVRNFLVDEDVVAYDEVTSRISQEKSVEGTLWYEIFYFSQDRTIVVSLQTEPLATARALAENELINKLGVSKDQLCKLNIRVSVPLEVSPMMAGKNLGVSGCLGSISI